MRTSEARKTRCVPVRPSASRTRSDAVVLRVRPSASQCPLPGAHGTHSPASVLGVSDSLVSKELGTHSNHPHHSPRRPQ